MRFTDLVVKWPGSTHDASVFDNSALKEFISANDNGHLLGDSGYPLRRYLLTPFLRPSNEEEEMYNRLHSSWRMVVERAFGLLKSRFRCLHKTGGCLNVNTTKACQIISACARLHNFCINNGIEIPHGVHVQIGNEDAVDRVEGDMPHNDAPCIASRLLGFCVIEMV